jgi:hypothetical protein
MAILDRKITRNPDFFRSSLRMKIMIGSVFGDDVLVRKAADILAEYLRKIHVGPIARPCALMDSDDHAISVVTATPDDNLDELIRRTGTAQLGSEEYVIVTDQCGSGQLIWIIGIDGKACLTGIYKLLAYFGCNFHLHGDLLPPLSDRLPQVDTVERYRPRFALRGTQLWCYWYSGRDVWSFDDYRKYLDQFPKLGLNLFDFPLYFYEPLYTGYVVGDVRPSGYFLSGRDISTVRYGEQEFAHAPPKFTSDAIPRYGSDELRTAAAIDLMRRVFDYAKSLGIRTCVGIEISNQLDFARDVANSLPIEDRYEDGRLIQPSSASGRKVLTARLQALFEAYPMCDYYSLWQSEAGVFRTTGGSPHPDDSALRNQLQLQYPSLKPSDADYVSWLRLADDIVSKIKPDVRLVTSGWGSEAVFACADTVLSERFICSSIAPYEPKMALESGGLDFYGQTEREKWNVTWAETDQHMWVMQPKLDATAAVVDRLQSDGVSAIMVLHWNTLFCGINLDFFASQCWSPSPLTEDFRLQWAERAYGENAAPAVVETLTALEQLNDLTVESDATMQSWVGYECFINPLLQAYRFIDVGKPLPDDWMATYVTPHLLFASKFATVLKAAVTRAEDALRLCGPSHAANGDRLLHRVEYVRNLYACHHQLAKVMQEWNTAVKAGDRGSMTRTLALLSDCDVTDTLAHFALGLNKHNGPTNIGELGLLLSLNEKFLGGVARLKGRMERAINGRPAPFRAVGENSLLTIWPGMQIPDVSLLARDDPHAPSSAPAAGLPRCASMDFIEGAPHLTVQVSDGTTAQRFSGELGFWRHLDAIRVTINAPTDFTDAVQTRIYLAEDVDWDSLFRRQQVIINGHVIGEYDDFLSQGEDMSEGYWVEAPAQFIDGKLLIEVVRKGNSDVVVAGIVVAASN